MVKLLFSSIRFCEIDSSFYRIPNAFMVKNWCKKTPTHFRFTAKFPNVITHYKRLKGVEKELELFFSSMVYLDDKILALLIQLPPSIGVVEGMNGLRDIMSELDVKFRYAVEVIVEIPDTGARTSSNTEQTSLSDFLK